MRVRNPQYVDTSEGPDTVEDHKIRLKEIPSKGITDAWFPTRQQAIDACKRFEKGERTEGGWSPTEFFASWKAGVNPDSEDEENPEDGWLVIFRVRSQMPYRWAEYWKIFNDRRARRRSNAL